MDLNMNVSVYIRRTKISIFRKALKSVGKLFGVGGSAKPLEIDPVQQAAKVKADSQLEANKSVQATVRSTEADNMNPALTPTTTDTTVNTEANKVLAPSNPNRPKWVRGGIFNKALDGNSNNLAHRLIRKMAGQ